MPTRKQCIISTQCEHDIKYYNNNNNNNCKTCSNATAAIICKYDPDARVSLAAIYITIAYDDVYDNNNNNNSLKSWSVSKVFEICVLVNRCPDVVVEKPTGKSHPPSHAFISFEPKTFTDRRCFFRVFIA